MRLLAIIFLILLSSCKGKQSTNNHSAEIIEQCFKSTIYSKEAESSTISGYLEVNLSFGVESSYALLSAPECGKFNLRVDISEQKNVLNSHIKKISRENKDRKIDCDNDCQRYDIAIIPIVAFWNLNEFPSELEPSIKISKFKKLGGLINFIEAFGGHEQMREFGRLHRREKSILEKALNNSSVQQ